VLYEEITKEIPSANNTVGNKKSKEKQTVGFAFLHSDFRTGL
jgi:hypothetical protein